MKRFGSIALALLLSAGIAAAQQEVTKRTERTETRESNGAVITKKTETISVTTYETRVRDAYVAIGVPQDIISRLVQLDVQIYHAWVSGDVVRVRELRDEKMRLLTPELKTKVTTYFEEHPVVVNSGAGELHVWGDVPQSSGGNVNVQGSKTSVERERGGAVAPSTSGGSKTVHRGKKHGTTEKSGQVPTSQQQMNAPSGTQSGATAPSSGQSDQNVAPSGTENQPSGSTTQPSGTENQPSGTENQPSGSSSSAPDSGASSSGSSGSSSQSNQ